jgi:ribosomal protein L29
MSTFKELIKNIEELRDHLAQLQPRTPTQEELYQNLVALLKEYYDARRKRS